MGGGEHDSGQEGAAIAARGGVVGAGFFPRHSCKWLIWWRVGNKKKCCGEELAASVLRRFGLERVLVGSGLAPTTSHLSFASPRSAAATAETQRENQSMAGDRGGVRGNFAGIARHGRWEGW